MVKIQLPVTLDLSEKLDEIIGSTSFTSLGEDSSSDYEITDFTFRVKPLEIEIDIELERIGGKFVSKEELAETLTEQIAWEFK
jgi:hypothetical protein